MENEEIIQTEEIDNLLDELNESANKSGYNLNPDTDFTRELIKGLLINKKRYGYIACPCRLASGEMKDDLDIICPCDYRDADLDDFGTCYCALYVDSMVKSGLKKVKSIPDRKFLENFKENKTLMQKNESFKIKNDTLNIKYPVWRCKVCGYLCARNQPPEICPVCKAGRERFEIFIDKK